MTLTLQTAKTLALNIDTATRILENSLRQPLQDYIDFTREHQNGRKPVRYYSADDYSFKEVDGSLFVFETEEFNYYGDLITDTMEIPFSFVDDPEAHKAAVIKSIRDAETAKTERTRKAAQDRVDNLKRQLEVAERSLEKTSK